MGNAESSTHAGPGENKENMSSFPGSAIVDALNCGSLDDAEDTPKSTKSGAMKGGPQHHGGKHGSGNHGNYHSLATFFSKTEELCAMSPTNSEFMGGGQSEFDEEYEEFGRDVTVEEAVAGSRSADDHNAPQPHPSQKKQAAAPSPTNPTSALFAKALVSEVTDNPNTMTPAAMAEREKRLLKAQEKARKSKGNSAIRPVGVPGGVGQPSVLGSIAHALTGTTDPLGVRSAGMVSSSTSGNDTPGASVLPPNSLSENRAAQVENSSSSIAQRAGKHTVTIGLSLTRRSSVGHPDTVTRQTAFDFNELQDREYKYVSSTDSSGWRAGGGERGGPVGAVDCSLDEGDRDFSGSNFSPHRKHAPSTEGGRRMDGSSSNQPVNSGSSNHPGTPNAQENYKVAAHDTVHIPIIHIDAESPQVVDSIIAALARGEVFIPHMAIIPEALSVNGVSPPDLVVRFGTERNDDLPPDEWPNWCLEFMHNQLYEYFHGMGARWMKRPFSITLAKKVRWKTVKHMNRYFAHAERVIDAWREKGPQYLDPQLAYIEGGATPEEVARPHGVYLLRNGIPTNYFAPNFDPPYTTKMTRSLLLNVLGKSWDKKRREWTSEPIPRLVTPSMLVTAMCGCGENQAGGFVATEATLVNGSNGMDVSTVIPADADIRSYDDPPRNTRERKQSESKSRTSGTKDTAGSGTDVVDSSAQPIGSTETSRKSRQSPHHESTFSSSSKITTSDADNSYVHERMLAQADYPQARTVANDQVVKSGDPQGTSTRTRRNNNEGDNLNVRIELQVSSGSTSFDGSEANSTGNASSVNQRSAISGFSAASSKYGRPPTPEGFRSPRNGLAPTFEEELLDRQQRSEKQHEQENTKPAPDSESGASNAAATSEVMQPSVAGSNSTILHKNLSAGTFVNQLKPYPESRSSGFVDDEKKEEHTRDPSGLSSDEDWLDELVRQKYKHLRNLKLLLL
jgi:hypothetical protein